MPIVEQNVGFALQLADRYSVLTRSEIVAEGAAATGDTEHMIQAHLRV